MSQSARVDSVDALKLFKVALLKFADAGDAALTDAESELSRTLQWLENEQRTHWGDQVRKRMEAVARAQEAVRQKKYFKDASGHTPSAIEEEKALAIAQRRLEEARQKMENCHKYARRLPKEIQVYKAGVQSLATALQTDVPSAAAHLESLIIKLEAYLALGPAAAAAAASSETAGTAAGAFDDTLPSMARPEPQEPDESPAPQAPPPPETKEGKQSS
jgi:hypothetical protein